MIKKSVVLTLFIFFGYWSQGQAQAINTFEREGLVSVSSELEDLSSGQMSRVYGVGSIIVTDKQGGMYKGTEEKNLRYFVLTVGHVSMGRNLKVKFGDGSLLPIGQVYHLASQDITLLEIDLKQYARKVYPFASFVKVNKGGFSFGTVNLLVAHLQLTNLRDLPDYSQNLVQDIYTDAQYMMVSIEGLNGVMMSRGALTGVVVPTWVDVRKIEKKEIDPYSSLSRDLLQKENHLIPVSFQPGMSGSPVVIGWRTETGYQHNVAGILTLVKENGTTTESSSAKSVNQFIEAALENQQGLHQRTSWFLFKNHFVRQQELELEFFLKSRPIGNGVVIDGYVARETVTSQFAQELLKKKVSGSQIKELQENLRKLTSADLNRMDKKGPFSFPNSQLIIKIK